MIFKPPNAVRPFAAMALLLAVTCAFAYGAIMKSPWYAAGRLRPGAARFMHADISPDRTSAIELVDGHLTVTDRRRRRTVVLTASGHASVTAAEFSPDASVVGGITNAPSLALWDVSTGRRIVERRLAAPAAWLNFAPSAALLAVARSDGVGLYASRSLATLAHIRTSRGARRAIFSPAGGELVTLDSGGETSVYDEGGVLRQRLGTFPDAVDVRYTEDGATIVIAERDGTAAVWRRHNVRTYVPIVVLILLSLGVLDAMYRKVPRGAVS